MDFIENAKDPAPADWLELANGGGVMLRDAAAPAAPSPRRYTRRRKQLPGKGDELAR
jgi:hypothetical protein